MFLRSQDFCFAAELEKEWPAIRDEYVRLASTEFMPWPEEHLSQGGWLVFGLYAFGQKLQYNCDLCPATVRLIEGIPGLVTAGFSVLTPGTRIKPHYGYSTAVVRCHLGLIVPEQCALEVAGVRRAWKPGECLIFDDTSKHAAWNESNADRAVLLLDVLRDGAKFDASSFAAAMDRSRHKTSREGQVPLGSKEKT